MAEPSDLPSILVGISGVYLVAAELSRRGYIASLTFRNTKGIAILASSQDASRQVGIQVKARHLRGAEWILSAKDERTAADKLFYVFVNLTGANGRPEFYVVPSKVVAETIRRGHRDWLARRGKRGQRHRDTSMRKFADPKRRFLNKWESLDL